MGLYIPSGSITMPDLVPTCKCIIDDLPECLFMDIIEKVIDRFKPKMPTPSNPPKTVGRRRLTGGNIAVMSPSPGWRPSRGFIDWFFGLSARVSDKLKVIGWCPANATSCVRATSGISSELLYLREQAARQAVLQARLTSGPLQLPPNFEIMVGSLEALITSLDRNLSTLAADLPAHSSGAGAPARRLQGEGSSLGMMIVEELM